MNTEGRICGNCGSLMAQVRSTEHRTTYTAYHLPVRSVSEGREYRYACSSCGHSITLFDARRRSALIATLVMAVIAVLMGAGLAIKLSSGTDSVRREMLVGIYLCIGIIVAALLVAVVSAVRLARDSRRARESPPRRPGG